MNTNLSLEQNKWIPSFSLFGRRELIIHYSMHQKSQKTFINRLAINPCYPKQNLLANSLTRHLYDLVRELKASSNHSYTTKISQLRNMMQSVVLVSDTNPESYHNIIYLTIKYLGYLVSQQAIQDGQSIDDQINLKSWLSDIHAIYYDSTTKQKKEMNLEEQLLLTFRFGKYEQMTKILRTMYIEIDYKDTNTLTKIEIIITILLLKHYQHIDNRFETNIQRSANKNKKIEVQRNKYSKLISSTNKSKYDIIDRIAEILFGKESSIQKFAAGSWPLYILNQPNFEELIAQQKIQEVRQIINRYIRKSKNQGYCTQIQRDYLLSLLTQPRLHHIYQASQALIPPFYSHFFAFLFDIISPDPLPNSLIEDYYADIVRNLLYHASEISFDSLVNVIAVIQDLNFIERRNQLYQPLLYHHLVVLDSEDQAELNDFLSKVKTLQFFGLQAQASFQLNNLFQKLLQNGIISRETLLIYCNCSVLFGSYYNYNQLLAYHLQEIYSKFEFDINFLGEYQNLIFQLDQQANRNFLKQLSQVEPLLKKFHLFKKITQKKGKDALILQLIQQTYRSLRLLQLISGRVEAITTSADVKDHTQNSQQLYFLNFVKEFLVHYPPQCSQKEKGLIHQIAKMIG